MKYSPHDLLPVKAPLNNPEPDGFFYEKVMKHLVPDILRIMSNGIPIDMSKVDELHKEVTSILENNRIKLQNNMFIKEYLENCKATKIQEKLDSQTDKCKTIKDYIKPYKKSDKIHRSYLINTILEDEGLDKYKLDSWTVKDMKKFLSIYPHSKVSFILDNKLVAIQDYVTKAMNILAEEKVNIYNKNRLDVVESYKSKFDNIEFNTRSAKQKNELFDMLGVDTLEYTDTGLRKINRAELERQLIHIATEETKEDINEELLEVFKEIVQVMIDNSNAYIINDNFIPAFNTYTINNMLYGNFTLFGTLTFRLTSTNPNLLQLPSSGNRFAKTIKRCFVVPENTILYTVDLSALEERVIANLSKDENKLNIFLEDLDSHCMNSYYYNPQLVEAILPREEGEELNDYLKRYKEAVETNKELKQIRQNSKGGSFALNYGCGPNKLVTTLGISEQQAKEIYNNFHNKLYPGITKFREELVLKKAQEDGRIHLGLGCYLHSDNVKLQERTLFNACSQYWSILTLLAVNKIHILIDEMGYQDDIKVICTIYDSIYFVVKEDTKYIKWLNDNIIPLLTTDFIEDQIVPNEAEGAIGYNWEDTITVHNSASVEDINSILLKLKEESNERKK